MAICTVTGLLETPAGKARGKVKARFVLVTSFGTATESYIAGEEASTITDNAGEFEIGLAVPTTGTIPYDVYIGDSDTALLRANLSAAMSPVDLAALILDAGSAEDIDSIPAIVAAYLNPAYVTLTDAATVVWDFESYPMRNAKVTLGGNRTLSITNLPAGAADGRLIVIQDATGGRTLALPANSKVINGGAGAVTLSSAAGARDVLAFAWDGTNYHWTVGLDFD